MPSLWERDGDAAYTTTLSLPDGRILHGRVEELPDGRWDWTTWQADSPTPPAHGAADTAPAAMAAADEALRRLQG